METTKSILEDYATDAELAAELGVCAKTLERWRAETPQGEGKPPSAALLESIHRAKTGALLRASLRMGAVYAGAAHEQYASYAAPPSTLSGRRFVW